MAIFGSQATKRALDPENGSTCNLRPPPRTGELLSVHTEQGHQQHHHDDVLHIPPGVQIEQDAEDHDLYELQRGRDTGHISQSESKQHVYSASGRHQEPRQSADASCWFETMRA